jgi:hypothetical protein
MLYISDISDIAMSHTYSKSVLLRVTPQWLRSVDDWRATHRLADGSMASQSDAIRRLVDHTISADAAKQFGQPVEQSR